MEVKAGQIWKDNDKRVGERFLKILELQDDKAVVVNVETNKKTKISLARFKPTSTGYVLVEDV